MRSLNELLQNYQPTDSNEVRHKQGMLELLTDTPAPFSRTQFSPGHFTASSFVLSPDLQSVLLIFHGKLHRWLQPGGHVDPDDRSIEAAARREVLEEVNIESMTPLHPEGGLFDLDIHPIPARKSEQKHAHYDIRFAFRTTSLDFRAGSDATDAKWVKLTKVPDLESDESVIRAIRKLL